MTPSNDQGNLRCPLGSSGGIARMVPRPVQLMKLRSSRCWRRVTLVLMISYGQTGCGNGFPSDKLLGFRRSKSAPSPQEGWLDPVAGTEQKDGLPASLCKAASNSRVWVVFIAVVLFVCAGLAILDGIFRLIQGANHHLPPVVALGLFELIFAIDVAAGGFLLSSYASRVANLKYSSYGIVLEKALDTLRTFWIYVSINLIVFLAFLLFVGVWVIAVGGTFPWV